MKCKTIQEIILTDYLDEQIGNAQKQEIETHLSACPLCRKFEAAARQTVIEPFKTAKRKETPAGVWDSIKKNIQEENEMAARNPMAAVYEKLNAFVSSPKPAFMLASSIFALVVGILFVFYSSKNNTITDVDTGSVKYVEYMAQLMDYSEPVSDEQNGGYGTIIEEYILY